ncbi:MAG: hypothetical protein U9P50_00245 [Patescibacteria group bacterium]|nr:hypothetical protein [Patescibacteria group bacterium]
MEKSEYLLIGVYLCVLGFAVPLTVVIVDFVVYEATFIDSFLAGSVIYLVIGLFSNFYIKKQYGKGFLPVNISDS